MKLLFRYAFFGCLLQLAVAANINNTASENINGQYLVDMGKLTNDPTLQAIGMAIKNLRRHRCSEWTSWSSCTAVTPGYFGIKNRTRRCNQESSLVKTETDLSICGILCPPDYNETMNGFCVKLHKSPVNRADADNQCQAKSGYVMNIDSKVKYEDIKNLTAGVTSGYLYIGGRRKNTNSPWMFEYGSQTGFFKWDSGQPSRSPSALCLYLSMHTKLMHSGPCSDRNLFICEIRL